MSTESIAIALPPENYAIAKRHPWLLFKVKGTHYAHRKEVLRKGEVVSAAKTVPFTADNEDIGPETRRLFSDAIKEMETGLT